MRRDWTVDRSAPHLKPSNGGNRFYTLSRALPTPSTSGRPSSEAWKYNDVAKMRALEDENRRLKRIVANYALENDALKIIAEGTPS